MSRSVRALVLVVAAVSAMALAASAEAAAPRYILVSGPGLERPIVLGDWSENLKLMVSLLPSGRPAAGWQHGRRRFDLALFWGVPARPAPIDPRKANQHGWFYPASPGRRAVFELLLDGQDIPRVASPASLRILARSGVPIRV